MPQTVLRGPNGGPAIDNATGQPLTMEEMLRRNGIVGVGNTVAMMGPQGSDPAQQGAPTPASGPVAGAPSSAVAGALAAKAGQAGVAPNANPNAAADDPAMAQLASTNTDPATVDMLEKAGMVAAGTAAAYGAYRLAKGLGGSATNQAAVNGATPAGTDGYGNKTLGYQMPEGEYTDVQPMKRVGNSTKQALQGRSAAAAIEGGKSPVAIGQTKALPNNGRTATAQAMAARAAQGQPNDVATIAAHGPVTTVAEPAEAGVARTLGMPQSLLQTLRKNPGLMRTLGRSM